MFLITSDLTALAGDDGGVDVAVLRFFRDDEDGTSFDFLTLEVDGWHLLSLGGEAESGESLADVDIEGDAGDIRQGVLLSEPPEGRVRLGLVKALLLLEKSDLRRC